MMVSKSPRVVVATAPHAGAVAIVQLEGPGSAGVVARLTETERAPSPGRLRLSRIADIDDAVIFALRDDWWQIMPHGGARVVQKVVDRLLDLGAVYDAEPDPAAVYPEASSPIEADVLGAMARAASPAAIDVLAAQAGLWRGVLAEGDAARRRLNGDEVLRRSAILDRLIDPPTVVVVGRPNVGKSTLTNAMLGRSVSIVADLPGTTRDWVAGLAELTPWAGGSDAGRAAVAVKWLDTPGLRASGDAIEQDAIAIARQVIEAADVVIAMRDPEIGWPDAAGLPRSPDLYVINKIDDLDDARGLGGSLEHPLSISAKTDRGLDRLQQVILSVLGLDALDPPPLWAFSPRLRGVMRREADLDAYLRGRSPEV